MILAPLLSRNLMLAGVSTSASAELKLMYGRKSIANEGLCGRAMKCSIMVYRVARDCQCPDKSMTSISPYYAI